MTNVLPRHTTREARADKYQGTVVLLITVTELGTADHIAVIKSVPDGLTDRDQFKQLVSGTSNRRLDRTGSRLLCGRRLR